MQILGRDISLRGLLGGRKQVTTEEAQDQAATATEAEATYEPSKTVVEESTEAPTVDTTTPSASEKATLENGKFKGSIKDLKRLSIEELNSITHLDIGSEIEALATALLEGSVTVPHALEEFKFKISCQEQKIDDVKNALDMIAYEISTQLGAEGLGREGQNVKFRADFKDIEESIAFAKKHPSIIGTEEAAKTLKNLASVNPQTRLKVTQDINAILDKAITAVEQTDSPIELDAVIPGSIFDIDNNGRDNYVTVIDKLTERMGTNTIAKATELKTKVEAKKSLDDGSTQTDQVVTVEDASEAVVASEVDTAEPTANAEQPAVTTDAEQSTVNAEQPAATDTEQPLAELDSMQATSDQTEEGNIFGVLASLTTDEANKARLEALAAADDATKAEVIDRLVRDFVFSAKIPSKALKEANKLSYLRNKSSGNLLTEVSYLNFRKTLMQGISDSSLREQGSNSAKAKTELEQSLITASEFNKIRDRHLEARMAKAKRDAQKAGLSIEVSRPNDIVAKLGEAAEALNTQKVDLDLSQVPSSSLERNPAFAQFLIDNTGKEITIKVPAGFKLDPSLSEIETIGPDGFANAEKALIYHGVEAKK